LVPARRFSKSAVMALSPQRDKGLDPRILTLEHPRIIG
jgi:hypothetical protein